MARNNLDAESQSIGLIVPAKKETITDKERARRIRETAREIETDNDPASFDRAFEKVVKPKPQEQRAKGD